MKGNDQSMDAKPRKMSTSVSNIAGAGLDAVVVNV